MGKQANTAIGINPLGSRRILRLPLLIIQTGVIDHCSGINSGKPPAV